MTSAAPLPAAASQSGTFHLDAPLAQVLPLFTAEGERAWVGGWEPEFLSGSEERGSAFRSHGYDSRETAWIVIDYRPAEGRVSYARVVRDWNIGLVDVVCSEAPAGGTDVTVRYTLTGLNRPGRNFVKEFLNPGQYAKMIEEWRVATSKALLLAAKKRAATGG
jgi:hypothetical protein